MNTMSDTAPTFSIIIPHHGPQEQLDRCLRSIPRRDDIQVIVVHDHDCRGAGWARNEGLRQAQGRYAIFADSDDYFLDTFPALLDEMRGATADMLFFNACSIDENTKKKSWRANHLNSIIASTDAPWRERHLRYHFTEPWCRAVSMAMIKHHDIRFGESVILNDIYFTTQAGCYAKDIHIYNNVAYCICNNAGSVGKRKGERHAIDATRQTAVSNMFLRHHGIDHYHSRMLRPFVKSLCRCHLKLATRCWSIMKEEGYTDGELLRYAAHYPVDVLKVLKHKILKGEFTN